MRKEIVRKELIEKIESLLLLARRQVASAVNVALLTTYMEIGKTIIEDQKERSNFDDYEQKSIRYISKVLTKKYGRGFSRLNISNMINFYRKYNGRTLSSHLGWSHYCELLSIREDDRRSFYEKECSNARWSVRELRRQIDSLLFERIVLAKKANQEVATQLANKGNEIFEPEDILKDPCFRVC